MIEFIYDYFVRLDNHWLDKIISNNMEPTGKCLLLR